MFSFFSFLFLLMTFFIKEKVNGDYYASISGLENLIIAESVLVRNLENYIKQIKNKNEIIADFLHEVKQHIVAATQNPVTHCDPISFLKIIKRLTKDWRDLKNFALSPKDAEVYQLNLTQEQKELKIDIPTYEDLIGAVKGLVRLQNTYALETHKLANGELLGRNYGARLTSSDCFQIGRFLFEQKDYELSVQWLLESKSQMQEQALNFSKISKKETVEYLAEAAQMNGNTKLAVLLTKEQIQINATNIKSVENLRLYEQILYNERTVGSNIDLTKTKSLSGSNQYEKTCRKELMQTPSQLRELRCRYTNNNVPFCIIAPFKNEELSLDPYIAYYHEIIYNSEITKIRKYAENQVERSRIVDDNIQYESDHRISKNTWLSFEDEPFLKNLAQRLEDITGLSIKTAEPLQVANYGIGGHYGPHLDEDDDMESDEERRILTALIYINKVELGGATAFPLLHLAVPPIKRSLLLWYNLHESLELDYRTKHAGCPVLKGSKWICNEWFNDRGQEFKRPCSLTQMGYKSIDYVYR